MSKPVVCQQCGLELPAGDGECPRCLPRPRSDDATTIGEAPAGDRAASGRVGDFRVLRAIGKGGMGTVYEAFEESMRRKVALKILDAGFLPSDKQIHRFEREAWIAGRLSHPNIVKVFGQGTEENTHYIAMELLDGRSLQDAIRDARKRRDEARSSDSAWRSGHVRQMVEMFVGIADALHHVHDQGIVHRDIKPGNLLLADEDSKLLLTDFGLARDLEASRMTRRGDFFGTIRYWSMAAYMSGKLGDDTGVGIAVRQSGDPSSTRTFVDGPDQEVAPVIHPSGKWVVYAAGNFGNLDTIVRPFPEGEGQWTASVGSGGFSHWSPDGEHLYYIRSEGGEDYLMEVAFDGSGSVPVLGQPVELFKIADDSIQAVGNDRFAMIVDEEPKEGEVIPDSNGIILVENWLSRFK